jgi:hypothetical protein
MAKTSTAIVPAIAIEEWRRINFNPALQYAHVSCQEFPDRRMTNGMVTSWLHFGHFAISVKTSRKRVGRER